MLSVAETPVPTVHNFSASYLRKCKWRVKRFKGELTGRYKKDPALKPYHDELLAILEWSFRENGGPTMAPPMSPRHRAWIHSLPPDQAALAFFCRLWYQHGPGVPWKIERV